MYTDYGHYGRVYGYQARVYVRALPRSRRGAHRDARDA